MSVWGNPILLGGGGGGSATIVSKTITENGTYNASSDNADGYDPVVVNVSGGGGTEAIPAVVWANSTYSSSPKQPWQAFGDVAGNFWGAGGRSAYMQITFGAAIAISKIKLANYYRVSTSTYWHSGDVTVRASNDDFSTYTDLYTGTGLAQSDTQFEINLNNTTPYKAYRLVCSDSTAYVGLGRIDLQVEGGSGDIENWDFTGATPTVGTIRGWSLTSTNVTFGSTGASFDSVSDRISFGVMSTPITIELDVASMSLTSGTPRRFIMGTDANGFIYRSTGVWAFYNGTWQDNTESDGAFFSGSVVKVVVDINNKWHIYKNGVLWWEPTGAQALTAAYIGSTANSINNAVIRSLKLR